MNGKTIVVPVLLNALILTGCGPGRGDVAGSVTYKGKLLTHGRVTFLGPDGVPVNADINADGTYQAKDILFGEVVVAVEQLPKNYKSPSELRKEIEAGVPIPPEKFLEMRSLLPGKYSNVGTSGLKLTVAQKQSQFDIPLVDDPS